ncbi:MAG: BMC domain-containing protein [Clostridia bacterium]|nr:BMC domain-containing protein [Clostridia bacterium]
MDITELSNKEKLRIVQELVPGKQITLAHVIASPDPILYTKLGLNPEIDFGRSAIGILTVSPAETAIIAADLATKTANVDLSFVDRFSGTLIITGMVADVETSIRSIAEYAKNTLNFTVCEITKT